MSEVVGLCRFSFVGRGDWVAWRGADEAQVDALRAETAARLYAPERMEARFRAFETLLLASLGAQTDPEWRLIVLTSDLMPAPMQERLHALVAGEPRVVVEVSGARDVDAGFLPVLDRLGLRDAVQFRIDDDDGLAVDYVARLRKMAGAMAGYDAWTFSIARGLVASFYPGEPARAYGLDMPFLGAGLAVRLPPRMRGGRTIFGFGHFRLARRWQAVTDNEGPGYLILRMPEHDSADLRPGSRAMKGHEPMEWAAFEAAVAQDFGFLDPGTLRTTLGL